MCEGGGEKVRVHVSVPLVPSSKRVDLAEKEGGKEGEKERTRVREGGRDRQTDR